jgi:VanZ family protein
MRSLTFWIPRIAAWLLAVTIIVLSVVPASLRPETDIPHSLEHFAAFFVTGAAFGFAYRRRAVAVAFALVLYSGLIETIQLFVPDRHARLGDFIVDALALSIGVALASIAGRALSAKVPNLVR